MIKEVHNEVSSVSTQIAGVQASTRAHRDQIPDRIEQSKAGTESNIEKLSGMLATHLQFSAKKSGRIVQFIGHDRNAILLPLLLCKQEFRKCILNILSCHSELVHVDYLRWLESEFDNIVTSATEEAAVRSSGSSDICSDTWEYLREVTSFLSNTSKATSIPGKVPFGQNRRRDFELDMERIRPGKKRKAWNESFIFNTKLGTLTVTVPSRNESSDSQTVRFSFQPKILMPHFGQAKYLYTTWTQEMAPSLVSV